MSIRPRDRASSRAEARRRARLAARGELQDEEAGETDASAGQPPPARSRGFLGRLFPPAPPLPNRPPPLAGFDESGPLRPLRLRAFLLRTNLAAWVVPGLVAGAGFFGSIYFGQDATLSLISTFVLFGALIAAGWFGWQRPHLYGTGAGILGYLLAVAALVGSSAMIGVTPEAFGTGPFITSLIIQGIYQAALGFLGGWYGGYLRRRQTQLSGERARASRRR
jgi:hypothetical protein